MGHASFRARTSYLACAAVALAGIALVCGCSGAPPGHTQNWKPTTARMGPTTRSSGPVKRAIVRPGTQVTPQEVLEESHKAAAKTVWCAVPGPGGKMIWVQVK